MLVRHHRRRPATGPGRDRLPHRMEHRDRHRTTRRSDRRLRRLAAAGRRTGRAGPPRNRRPPRPDPGPRLEMGHRDRQATTGPPTRCRRTPHRRPHRPQRPEPPQHRHTPTHAGPLAHTHTRTVTTPVEEASGIQNLSWRSCHGCGGSTATFPSRAGVFRTSSTLGPAGPGGCSKATCRTGTALAEWHPNEQHAVLLPPDYCSCRCPAAPSSKGRCCQCSSAGARTSPAFTAAHRAQVGLAQAPAGMFLRNWSRRPRRQEAEIAGPRDLPNRPDHSRSRQAPRSLA
jgi:hypothetical protein